MAIDPTDIQPGMLVRDARGVTVGTVKGVQDTEVLVDLPMRRDVYMPVSVVLDVDAEAVTLAVAAERIGQLDWRHPPLFSGEDGDDAAAPAGDQAEIRTEPLDTRPGRPLTAGLDDGDNPPPADLEAEERRLIDMHG